MDPNACLKAIRILVKDMDAEQNIYSLTMKAEELAVLIAGLDDWLTRGGFLPKAWTHTNKGD